MEDFGSITGYSGTINFYYPVNQLTNYDETQTHELGRSQYLVWGKNIQYGKNVEIGNFCIIGDNVVLGDNVKIGNYCEIRDNCKIGKNTKFGSRITLCAGTIIGENCIIKYGCVTTDTINLKEPDVKVPPFIGNNVRIGANVTIMPDVLIGDGVIIGACSQVRHDVKQDSVVYGNPVR